MNIVNLLQSINGSVDFHLNERILHLLVLSYLELPEFIFLLVLISTNPQLNYRSFIETGI